MELKDLSFSLLADGRSIAVNDRGVVDIYCAQSFLSSIEFSVRKGPQSRLRFGWQRWEFTLTCRSAAAHEMVRGTGQERVWSFSFPSEKQALQAQAHMLQSLSLSAGKPTALRGFTKPKVDRLSTRARFALSLGLITITAGYLFSPVPAVETFDSTMAYSTPDVISHAKLSDEPLASLNRLQSAGINILPADGAPNTTRKKPVVYVLNQPGSRDDLMLSELAESYQPIVIPFWVEKDESGELVRQLSHVYCSTSPSETWQSLAAGNALPEGMASCHWADKARLNAIIGPLTGLDKTVEALPFYIAPNGAIHEGKVQASHPVQSLKEWLDLNVRAMAADTKGQSE